MHLRPLHNILLQAVALRQRHRVQLPAVEDLVPAQQRIVRVRRRPLLPVGKQGCAILHSDVHFVLEAEKLLQLEVFLQLLQKLVLGGCCKGSEVRPHAQKIFLRQGAVEFSSVHVSVG